jgi:hypothetical protein
MADNMLNPYLSYNIFGYGRISEEINLHALYRGGAALKLVYHFCIAIRAHARLPQRFPGGRGNRHGADGFYKTESAEKGREVVEIKSYGQSASSRSHSLRNCSLSTGTTPTCSHTSPPAILDISAISRASRVSA